MNQPLNEAPYTSASRGYTPLTSRYTLAEGSNTPRDAGYTPNEAAYTSVVPFRTPHRSRHTLDDATNTPNHPSCTSAGQS
ncbi:MAG: hypothetical protein ABJE47_06820 [bacterium]